MRPEPDPSSRPDPEPEDVELTPARGLGDWMRDQPTSTRNRADDGWAPSAPLAAVLVAGLAALMAITALAVWLRA